MVRADATSAPCHRLARRAGGDEGSVAPGSAPTDDGELPEPPACAADEEEVALELEPRRRQDGSGPRAGNTVVLKPSEQAPLTVMRIVELLKMPTGVWR